MSARRSTPVRRPKHAEHPSDLTPPRRHIDAGECDRPGPLSATQNTGPDIALEPQVRRTASGVRPHRVRGSLVSGSGGGARGQDPKGTVVDVPTAIRTAWRSLPGRDPAARPRASRCAAPRRARAGARDTDRAIDRGHAGRPGAASRRALVSRVALVLYHAALAHGRLGHRSRYALGAGLVRSRARRRPRRPLGDRDRYLRM